MLERIQKANDIKKLAPEELPELAQEIRQFLIEKISRTGGHLASNLGVVELTMAIHLVFDLPKDKIIWDVGHQSYTHKILTGRKDGFDDLRKYGGMSGFPKRKESACDAFDTGHSSTSISAGLGYVCARDLQKEDYSVISVIGDGSLTGGMAYEALNNASRLKKNFIIVLNDNHDDVTKEKVFYNGTAISMGNPHFVTFVDDVDSLNLEELGPQFEHHKLFPEGVNTEFVQVLDKNTVKFRVWERGSGETWACGTGASAVTVACIMLNKAGKKGEPLNVHCKGGLLKVTHELNDHVTLEGNAVAVFDGVIDIPGSVINE